MEQDCIWRVRLRPAGLFIATAMAWVFLWAGAAMAQDENWIATIAPPANGTAYGPVEPLKIQTPEQVPFEVLLRLGLEIDAIDVTPLLAFENQTFTYRPPQALSPGQHMLRLVETLSNGGIRERGTWTIMVSTGETALENGEQPSLFAASATNSLELSQRLADKGLENAPSRSQVSGGGYGNSSYSKGPWSFTGTGNYLIQTEKANAPSGHRVDLGEYNVTSRYDGEEFFGHVALGQQDLGADNFIMSNFNRRGASASLGSTDQTISVTGFGFRSETVTGFEDFTGLTKSDDRLQGILAKANPVPDWGENFAVTGIYYAGEGSDGGIGIGGDTVTNQGNGWGIGAEGYLLDRSIQVKGQFARTNFEYGGVVIGDAEESGNAWSMSVAYSPIQGEEIGGEFMNLTLGAQYERIDTFFSSLPNPYLAVDRDGVLLYSDLSWGGITANTQGLYQTNNVDDLAGIPTDRLLSFQFSGNYYPTVDAPAAGEIDWLGQPYLNLNLGFASNDRIDTPVGYAGTGTDNRTSSITLGGGSSYSQWSWQVSENYSRFEDDTGNSSDTDSYLTNVTANWSVSDALQMDAGVQWGLFQDKSLGSSTQSINLNLGVQAEIIPGTLKTKANYNLNLLAGDGDTPDNTIANGEVEWTLIPPQENNIGVALAFQGLLENRSGNADDSFDGTSWQIYGVLRLSAPLAY